MSQVKITFRISRFILLFGFFVVLSSLFMDVSIGGRIVNIDLVSYRQIIMIFGCTCLVVGVLFWLNGGEKDKVCFGFRFSVGSFVGWFDRVMTCFYRLLSEICGGVTYRGLSVLIMIVLICLVIYEIKNETSLELSFFVAALTLTPVFFNRVHSFSSYSLIEKFIWYTLTILGVFLFVLKVMPRIMLSWQ